MGGLVLAAAACAIILSADFIPPSADGTDVGDAASGDVANSFGGSGGGRLLEVGDTSITALHTPSDQTEAAGAAWLLLGSSFFLVAM